MAINQVMDLGIGAMAMAIRIISRNMRGMKNAHGTEKDRENDVKEPPQLVTDNPIGFPDCVVRPRCNLRERIGGGAQCHGVDHANRE